MSALCKDIVLTPLVPVGRVADSTILVSPSVLSCEEVCNKTIDELSRKKKRWQIGKKLCFIWAGTSR